MSRLVIKPPDTKAVIAYLELYGKQAAERAKGVVVDSMERAYDMAQSLCEVDTGETKSKMRKVLAPDGFSYQMGFFVDDFPTGDFVPLFLEYGTTDTASHPCIQPTKKAERSRFPVELAEAVRPR